MNQAEESTRPSATLSRQTLLIGALAIVLMVFLAYGPAIGGGYIWDDDFHLTENENLKDAAGLKRIWSSTASIYYPLVLTTFWGMRQVFGLEPLAYHFLNVALHILNALMLWAVFRRLRVRGAWLGAALFAIHPIQVDTAAWVTEIKNTQSTFFLLLSMLAFLRWNRASEDDGGWSGAAWLGVSTLLFIPALLSKTSTVMYPVVLVVCLWWLHGRWRLRWTAVVAPFFVLSGLAAAWTVWGHNVYAGVHGGEWSETLVERVLIAGRIIWFYIGKIVWPQPLIFIYPRFEVDPARALDWLPVVLVVVALGVMIWKHRSWGRPALAAALCYGANLFPVLWFFSGYFTRYSYVADHFQYLAGMSVFALIGALVWNGPADPLKEWSRLSTASRARAAGAGLLLAVCCVLTWSHARAYHDAEALWRDNLKKNPDAWLAHYHLAQLLVDTDRLEEALPHYRTALEQKPSEEYIRVNFAIALASAGKLDEAIELYREALKQNPANVIAQINLADAYAMKGDMDEAIAQYEKAIEQDPQNADVQMNLGVTLAGLKRFGEAEKHLAEAARLEPEWVEAQFNLALVLSDAGKSREAAEQFRRVIGLRPDLLEASNQLAWILATDADDSVRDGDEALRLAEQVCERTGRKHPGYLKTLAAAQAETGDFAKARETAAEALKRARALKADSLAEEIAAQLKVYENDQPVRKPAAPNP